jgi:hypothetical protein
VTYVAIDLTGGERRTVPIRGEGVVAAHTPPRSSTRSGKKQRRA